MPQTRQLKLLPDWFKLTNYSSSKSFRATEWYINLNARRNLLLDHPDYVYKLPKTHENYRRCIAYWRSTLSPMVGNLQSNPILKLDNQDLDLPPLSQPIQPVTIGELHIASFIELDLAERQPTSHNIFTAEKWKVLGDRGRKLTSDIADLELTTFQKSVLSVNLNATDHVLHAAFSDWLKNKRSASTNPSCKREKPAYENWFRYGLLPYLDLLIWSEQTGNRITYENMAQAVNYHPGGDSFRKVVRPLALRLMSCLAELECLAAREASKPHPEQLEGQVIPE